MNHKKELQWSLWLSSRVEIVFSTKNDVLEGSRASRKLRLLSCVMRAFNMVLKDVGGVERIQHTL